MIQADGRFLRQNSISVKTPHTQNKDPARRKTTLVHAATDSFAKTCQRGDFQSNNSQPSAVSDKQP